MNLSNPDQHFNVTNLIQKYPVGIFDSFKPLLPFIIVGLLVWAFVPLMVVTLVSLIREKQEKVKEIMKVMGMNESMYWMR